MKTGTMKNKLKSINEKRSGSTNTAERDFIGFSVDGESIRNILKTDNITGVGWGNPDEQKRYIDQLLGNQESKLNSKRIPLYLCAECGDLGCGAITIEIKKGNGKVVWAQFGFENNYENEVHSTDIYQNIGPYEFEEKEYAELLASIRAKIK
jgi:hypothetical protein